MADVLSFHVTVVRKADLLQLMITEAAGDTHASHVAQIVTKFLAATTPMPREQRPECLVCGRPGDEQFNPAAIVCMTPVIAEGEEVRMVVPSGWLCDDCSAKGNQAAIAALMKIMPNLRLQSEGTETVQ